MKKIILLLVITFMWVTPAFALIRTRNVEVEDYGTGDSNFKYKVAYSFATYDIGGSLSAVEIPVSFDTTTAYNKYYTMPFKGRIVGVSIAASAASTAGSVTADVTINGTVTGVTTSLDAGPTTKFPNSGLVASHAQYNAQTQPWDDDSPNFGSTGYHDANHQNGKATDLEVGDRLGVKITNTTDYTPQTNDLVVTVIILQ